MASYTQHYQRHQWESNDSFLHTDFNEELKKIGTVLGTISEVVTGSYTGATASEDSSSVQQISLGFQPKRVAVVPCDGMPCKPGFGSAFLGYAGMCAPDQPVCTDGDSGTWNLRATATGFEVRNCATGYCDVQSKNYYLSKKPGKSWTFSTG